jgi:predicted PurR-regulated permease PerM
MPNPDRAEAPDPSRDAELEPQTNALQLIAGLLLLGAAMLLGSILVPTLLALVLAIALSPVVSWLERKGVPTALGSLACLLGVASILGLMLGLLLYQAGTVLGESDRYIEGLSKLAARVSTRTGGDDLLGELGLFEGRDRSGEGGGASGGSASGWERLLRGNLRAAGGWVAAGLGGLVGFVAGLVVFLAFLFYMLQTRADWSERLSLASMRLGLRPRLRSIGTTRREIEVFVGFVSLVAFCYMVVSTVVYWLVGLPSPLLWGLLTGMLEFIPFFGPIVAAGLVLLVSLTLGTLWQPLVLLGFFVALHVVEGYVVTPMVYGSAVKIDPVSSLFGVLFFGWVWGPLGSMLAMPMLILLRGLIVMAPDTPALDALADVEGRKNEEQAEDRVPAASGSGGRAGLNRPA